LFFYAKVDIFHKFAPQYTTAGKLTDEKGIHKTMLRDGYKDVEL
jgi:hypothetical protein